MKTAHIILTASMLLSSLAFGQAADTTREINAQATITRGHIDNILSKINNQRSDTGFKATDYYAQAQSFKNEVDALLRTFEDNLERNIFPKAALLMNQYNSIATSNEFSKEQKENLLKERFINIEKEFSKLSNEYKAAVVKVYELIPFTEQCEFQFTQESVTYNDYRGFEAETTMFIVIGNYKSRPINVKLTKEAGSRKKDGWLKITVDGKYEIERSSPRGLTRGENELFKRMNTLNFRELFNYERHAYFFRVGFLNDENYNNYVFPKIRGKCKSSICVGLRAGDYASYLSLVKELIDRDIVFNLADGKQVALKKYDADIERTMNSLRRVDYPVQLPFDL